MLDWLKNINKDYPDFWKSYIQKFQNKSKRIIAFSCETSGINPSKDVVLSIGAIGIYDDKIIVKDAFEVILLQYKYLHDNGLSNEFIIVSKQEKLTEYDALKVFLEYIENAILVGHRANQDIELLNEALSRMDCGRIKNETLDIEVMFNKIKDTYEKKYTLDEMCNFFKIEPSHRNEVIDDAYSIALLFLKMKSKLQL